MVSLTADCISRNEYKNARRVLKGTCLFAVFVIAVCFAFFFFGAGQTARAVFGAGDLSVVLRYLTFTLLILAALGIFQGHMSCSEDDRMKVQTAGIIGRAVAAIASVLIASIMATRGNAYGAVGGILGFGVGAASSILCFAGIKIYRTGLSKKGDKKKGERNFKDGKLGYLKIMRALIVAAMPICASRIIFRVSDLADMILFHKLLEIGGYKESVRMEMYGSYFGEFRLILEMVLALTAVAGIAMLSGVYEAARSKDTEQMHRKMNFVIRITAVAAMPFGVGLSLLAEPVIQLVFSDITEIPAGILRVGAPLIVLYTLVAVTTLLMSATGEKLRTTLIHVLIAMLVHLPVIAVLFLFTDFNIYAIIYGNYVFTAVMIFLNLRRLRKSSGFKMAYGIDLVVPLIAALIMGVISSLSYHGVQLLIRSTGAGLLISAVLSAIAYSLGILVFDVLSEEEILSLPFGSTLVRFCKKIHVL